MPFTERSLLPFLDPPLQQGFWWVAYSGGMDSHVLLAALRRLLAERGEEGRLRAVHVNHGISAQADTWQAHCEMQCRALGVEFHAHRLNLPDTPGESLETRARHARYGVFAAVLEGGGVLFQAHHQDDQMETLLYRLGRGSGPLGLGGMPARRALGRGELRRPLLGFARRELEDYARRAGLHWIEDESNADERFDRNFLRHRILPSLEERWPSLRGGWQRSMTLCAEAAVLLDELGRQDLDGARTPLPNAIETAPLSALDEPRQRNLLRRWFDELSRGHGLPPPDFHSLRRITEEVLPAAPDAAPLVSWPGPGGRVDVRRFAGRLYALRPLETAPGEGILEWPSRRGAKAARAAAVSTESDASAAVLPSPLDLGGGLGVLHLEAVARGGFMLAQAGPLSVRFRAGGERAKEAGRRTRALKKILQDHGVPPWLRDHVPLVYAGDDLLAVADLFLCEPWARREGPGLFRIRWERSLIHCGY